jgi:Yip1 domain
MTSAAEATAAAGQAGNVFTRLALVVTSPGRAYAEVAAEPRALGALAIVIGIMIVCQFTFLSTTVGQQVMIEQQLRTMESFGVKVTDEMENELQASAGNARFTTAASQVVFIPIVTALIAGLLLGIFNATSERASTFKHVYAIAAHSSVIFAIQQIVTTPISYLMGEFAAVTRLTVFLPMLEEDSFLSHLLSGIELFALWWLVNLAIGIAVLYRRPTRPVTLTLMGVYAAILVCIALLQTVF